MEYVAFGDESGTTGSDRCYGIGLLCIRKNTLVVFNERIQKLKDKYGIVGELKWSKIKNSAGQANICLELLSLVLRNSCCFHSIIVVKNGYNNWQTNREMAFYKTYTLLVKNVARQLKSPLEVIIDQKIDKYKKNDEVTGIIANNMLANAGIAKLVTSVTMHDSKHYLGLQVVDILTGAVNSGYLKFLNPQLQLSVAKEIAFKRMAAMLGWDAFHYDTYPNKDFNIWHFPPEMRGVPGSMRIRPNYGVPLVMRDELA
ncbi:DUF3800 domain-containing protein [Salmonella enterica subsp. enterica serovar Newport]|nr:hypothetical protein [Salmonella enterica subsp. enterica serovar Typhimurium]EBW3415598.1 hypothetical protein [Salmonella enterica subsp. enterica serovar Newport]ECA0182171.1 DUF3800 domain-containing protein [Salmonella enterica subsp. enterica serovar Virchow]EHQ8441709.1 DUF3800 domain-containing protein [Salmonella enterica subsp. enterica serovar Java]EHU7139308.1 DUF3800 domain-containing protein [Salmonella enterica]